MVHKIIPFSNVEGRGNRCSIFLQGCNIHCVYCHNPETISRKSNRVMEFSPEALAEKVGENIPFIRGVTASGGEPTIQAEALSVFFKLLKPLGLTCYVDTNGFFDCCKIKPLIDLTDKFLFDIKGFGEGLNRLCFEDKQPPQNFCNLGFENLRLLLKENKVEEVRLVCVTGFYNVEKTIEKICEILPAYSAVPLKLIRVHIRGAGNANSFRHLVPSEEKMFKWEKQASRLGIKKVKVIL